MLVFMLKFSAVYFRNVTFCYFFWCISLMKVVFYKQDLYRSLIICCNFVSPKDSIFNLVLKNNTFKGFL